MCVFLFISLKIETSYLGGNECEMEHLTSHMAQMTKQKLGALFMEHTGSARTMVIVFG